MRRGRLRGVLLAVVLLALGGIGFLLGRTLLAQRQAEKETSGEALEPEVSQRIREFRRVKVEDGKEVWELRAREAEFFEDQSRIIVEHPEMSFFGKGGENVKVSGARGEVVLSGTDVGRIDLRGGIQVRVGETLLETPEASWIGSLDSIVAAQGVRVSGKALSLTGDVMFVELGTRRLRVVGHVRTETHGAPDEIGRELEVGVNPDNAVGERGGAAP